VSKDRITIETLAAGQPRPYADTVRHVRVTFEWQGMEGYKDKDAPFVPRDKFSEETVRRMLAGVAGFTAKTAKDPDCNWFDTRLDWLKSTGPGVWEFHTTSPYTD
jgi:hypothetical protein